jgi:hypothetical protein
MPLIQSATKKALSENIAREQRAGKPPAQAAAIAYSVQREARKSGSHSRHIEELGSAYEQSVSSGAKPEYHATVTLSRSPKKGRGS